MEAAAGACASELGIVKDPSSEAARSELRALVARLEEAMSAKIKERAASLKDAKTGAKMLQDYHSALVYCSDNYSRVYKLAHEIIKSGEEPGIARYGTAVGVLGELTKGVAVQHFARCSARRRPSPRRCWPTPRAQSQRSTR